MKNILTGRGLFGFRKRQVEHIIGNSRNKIKESKFLQDFYREGNGGEIPEELLRLGNLQAYSYSDSWHNLSGTQANPYDNVTRIRQEADKANADEEKRKKEERKEKGIKEYTPKEVYHLQTLNDKGFELNVNEDFVSEQIESFTQKLELLQASEFDMERGVEEVASMLSRFDNRLKYEQYEEFYNQYPYTTTLHIKALVKVQDYLKIGKVEQFIADMPIVAIKKMAEYTKITKEMCGKNPRFYIIANKKDFKKSDSRRDPILLAQSPFSHAWQILGAWDEEMLFLDEL